MAKSKKRKPKPSPAMGAQTKQETTSQNKAEKAKGENEMTDVEKRFEEIEKRLEAVEENNKRLDKIEKLLVMMDQKMEKETGVKTTELTEVVDTTENKKFSVTGFAKEHPVATGVTAAALAAGAVYCGYKLFNSGDDYEDADVRVVDTTI